MADISLYVLQLSLILILNILIKKKKQKQFVCWKSWLEISFFFSPLSTFLYLKFLVVWALVLLADFVLEFRFEYLWPFWLFIRSVYDSFRYQGLVSGHCIPSIPGIFQIFQREYSMFHSCPNGTEVLLTAQGFSLIYLFSLVDILSMGSGNKTKIYPNFTTEKYNLNSWAGFELIRIMYNLIYVNKQDFLYYFKENSVI